MKYDGMTARYYSEINGVLVNEEGATYVIAHGPEGPNLCPSLWDRHTPGNFLRGEKTPLERGEYLTALKTLSKTAASAASAASEDAAFYVERCNDGGDFAASFYYRGPWPSDNVEDESSPDWQRLMHVRQRADKVIFLVRGTCQD